MQYLVIAYDKKDALNRRLETREAHIQNVRRLMAKGKIINAGALMNDDGNMIGSTLFIDFDTKEEIDEWLANEPYVKNDVWDMSNFKMISMKLLSKWLDELSYFLVSIPIFVYFLYIELRNNSHYSNINLQMTT